MQNMQTLLAIGRTLGSTLEKGPFMTFCNSLAYSRLKLRVAMAGFLIVPAMLSPASAVTLVDSAPVPSFVGNTSSGATLTVVNAYTVPSGGSDRVLVVFYTSRAFSTAATTTTGATFGGVPMTKAAELGHYEGTDPQQTTSVYYLKQADFAPSFTSAPQTVTITRSTDNNGDYDDGYTVSIFTLSGVNQATPVGVTGLIGVNGGAAGDTALLVSRSLTGLSQGSVVVSGISVAQGQPTTTVSANSNIDRVLVSNLLGGNHRAMVGLTNPLNTSETLSYIYTSSTNSRAALAAVEFIGVPPAVVSSGDASVGGTLSVGGALDVSGNDITLGTSGQSYGAGFFYDEGGSPKLVFDLADANAAWSWQRGSSVGMVLDSQNRLGLGTSTPAAKLHVVGPGLFSPGSLTVNAGSGQTGDIFQNANQGGTIGHYMFRDGAASSTGAAAYGLRYTDTFNTNPSSTRLSLVTQGSERISVLADGKVGVGTSSPTHRLDVNGNARVGTQLGVMVDANPNAYLQVGTNGGSSIIRDLYPVFGIDTRPTNSGDGGVIGVYSWPIQAKNPVGPTGDVTAYIGKVRAAGGVVVNGRVLEAQSPEVSNNGSSFTNVFGVYIHAQKAFGVTNGYGIYQVGPNDANYFAGSVGIGTSTPSAKLDVVGDARISGTLSVNGVPVMAGSGGSFTGGITVANDSSTAGGLTLGSGNSSDGANLRLRSGSTHPQWNIDNYSGNLRVFTETSPDVGTAVRMTISQSGMVGIGTTAPEEKLEVKDGRIRASSTASGPTKYVELYQSGEAGVLSANNPGPWGSLRLSASGATFEFIANPWGLNFYSSLQYSGVRDFSIVNSSLTKGIAFHTSGDAMPKVYIHNTGNLGVGTLTPSEKLEVSGNIKASGTITAAKIRVPASGDLSMGLFTSGVAP